MIERGAGAVIISAIPLFINNADEIVRLAERHKIPAMYPGRPYVLRGGLMSYTRDERRPFEWQWVSWVKSSKAQNPLTCRSETLINLISSSI